MDNQYEKDQDQSQRRPDQKNEGNFKNDPEKARDAGRKGGEASRGRR